jgi:hypothetical protein
MLVIPSDAGRNAMRLRHVLEWVFAIGVGLGLARHRVVGMDYYEVLSGFAVFQVGVDAFFAGVGLVGGLGVLVERLGGRPAVPWGPGRRTWLLVASYLVLTQLDMAVGTAASRLDPGLFFQGSIVDDIFNGLREDYGPFLLPPMAWFLLALGLTSLADAPRPARPADAKEWGGRVFAGLIVSTWLGLRILIWLGVYRGSMGGGMS